jgi:hypothetical protein
MPHQQAHRVRLHVEQLEDKIVPSTITVRNLHIPSLLSEFNGMYRISYAGTGNLPNGGTRTVNGSYSVTVNNGKVIDQAGVKGSGHISPSGAIDATATYQGIFIHITGKGTLSHGHLSAGGMWTGTFQGVTASGSWHAAHA